MTDTQREPASIIGEFIDDASLMETGRSIGTVGSYRVAQSLLATDDPAAVAAIANEWAARHPAALLDALTNAGVLTERWRWHNEGVNGLYGFGAFGGEATTKPHAYDDDAPPQRRLVTAWTEVQP